jgi:hypothetical protein
VQPNLVNFTYIEEWYEGRYTTNLLQVPNFEGSRSYGSHEIVSTPDRYTTFLLPNRTNLASNLSAEFEDISGDDNTDAQGAIGPGPLAGDDDVRLLGGDYLVMTSFRHTSGAPQPTTTTTTTEPSPTTTTPTTPPTTTQPTTTTGGGGQQTPGFELVALLAALGAAFVLVRRRL